jgi:TrmH family RNA methyltransferase
LIRTAAAFNWGFGHTSGSADPWSPKVLRSGAGGHFRVGISEVAVLEDIEAQGFIPVSAVVSGGVSPADLDPGRYAVLVGDESAGLPPEVVKGSAIRVTIPMAGGTESLNAAISAAIIVYELSKPERDAGGRV